MAYNKLPTWQVDVNADSTVAETTFSARPLMTSRYATSNYSIINCVLQKFHTYFVHRFCLGVVLTKVACIF